MQRAIGLCFALICLTVAAQAKYLDENIQYVQNRFIVKLQPGVGGLEPVTEGGSVRVADSELTLLNQKWNVTQVERLFQGASASEAPEIDLPGYWRFWLSERVDLETLLSAYDAVLIVEHVEPVAIHEIYYSPNDPYWSYQWHVYDTPLDHDIDAVEAWDTERGDSLAILGITDTGVQYSHPDLSAQIWKNWSEVHGTPGYDDDGNGLVDDSIGWDFVTGLGDVYPGEDGDVQDNDPKDFNGHGTHCSGIAAATTNNGIGVCGVAGGGGEFPGARILPLRVGWTATNGYGYVGMDFCAQGIDYARQKGACAINCSWGSSNNGGLSAAVDAAIAAGVVFCVAAGNGNSQTQSYLGSRDDCIDVAATDSDDIRAPFSNYGDWVDVSAPGVNIYATYSHRYQNIYDYLSGTSMAAPCVTGEVGILKSMYPEWSGVEITNAIFNNVDNIYDENPSYIGMLGSGRINVNLALFSQANVTLLEPNGGENWTLGTAETIRWTAENYTGNINLSINRSYPHGFWENIAIEIPNSGEHIWTVTVPTTDRARVRVIAASNPTLADTSDANFTISLANIALVYPNGGENWCAGQTETILWDDAGSGGTVTISLNRSFPSGAWETLLNHTANDGSESWEVSGAASSSARLRVISDDTPSRGDSSDADFTIISPCIEVTSPVGDELWTIGESHPLTWISGGVSGDVEIAINRDYPAGDWEVLFANAANDGEENWIVASPPSPQCRIRVKSVNEPDVFSITPEDFWIIHPNEAPQIVHDPLHDIWELPALLTAVILDESLPQPPVIQLYYRLENAPHYSHTILEATGYPNEYAALLETLDEERYDYYIRAVDALGAADSTSIFSFDIGSSCPEEMAYDDGEGEQFDWMEDTRFRWAVKFSPETFPFALCAARFAVAHSEPNANHEPVFVEIYHEESGVPGELLYSGITGSVGNVVGGLPEGVPLWADVVLRDSDFPLIFENDIFIAVSNPDTNGYEAFARDTTSANSNRSFFYDPGDGEWHNENDAVPNARPGNRLIRANGFTYQFPDVFALLSPANMDTIWTLTPTLDWENAASSNPYDAIHYVLYWSLDSEFLDADSIVTDSSFYNFTEGELPDDVTVYWKVRAVNFAGLSRWCESETGWSFVVFFREPPNPFHLVSPADSTMFWLPNVELQWEAATDPDPGDSAAFYRVFLAEDINFSDVDSFDLSETSLELTNLEGWEYWWKVRAYDTGGLWRESDELWYFWISLPTNPDESDGIPKEFALEQNYPNPFNPSTTIRIALPERSHAAIEIYDILGRRVAVLANRDFHAGYHQLQWQCESCAAGIYFVQMRTEDFVQTRKMLLVR